MGNDQNCWNNFFGDAIQLSGGRIRAPSYGIQIQWLKGKVIAEAFFGRRDVNMASKVTAA